MIRGKIKDYEVKIVIHCLPFENHDALMLEIKDILENVEILPYDFDVNVEVKGEWL